MLHTHVDNIIPDSRNQRLSGKCDVSIAHRLPCDVFTIHVHTSSCLMALSRSRNKFKSTSSSIWMTSWDCPLKQQIDCCIIASSTNHRHNTVMNELIMFMHVCMMTLLQSCTYVQQLCNCCARWVTIMSTTNSHTICLLEPIMKNIQWHTVTWMTNTALAYNDTIRMITAEGEKHYVYTRTNSLDTHIHHNIWMAEWLKPLTHHVN